MARSQSRWDAFLPHLPSLADADVTGSGLVAPLQARCANLSTISPPVLVLQLSIGAARLNLLVLTRVLLHGLTTA